MVSLQCKLIFAFFNITENIYTYNEAKDVCKLFNAELASYDQIKKAYEKGADWCNYGWSKGQNAYYPTQLKSWKKLQNGDWPDCSKLEGEQENCELK